MARVGMRSRGLESSCIQEAANHPGGAEQDTRSAVDVGRDPDRNRWGKPHKTNGANGPPVQLTLPDPTVLDQDFSLLGKLSGDYLRRQIWSSVNSIWSQEQKVKMQKWECRSRDG